MEALLANADEEGQSSRTAAFLIKVAVGRKGTNSVVVVAEGGLPQHAGAEGQHRVLVAEDQHRLLVAEDQHRLWVVVTPMVATESLGRPRRVRSTMVLLLNLRAELRMLWRARRNTRRTPTQGLVPRWMRIMPRSGSARILRCNWIAPYALKSTTPTSALY